MHPIHLATATPWHLPDTFGYVIIAGALMGL